MGTAREGFNSFIPSRALCSKKWLKLSLVLLLSSFIFVTLFQTESLKKFQSKIFHERNLGKTLNTKTHHNTEEASGPLHARGFTSYTIRRLGLTPLAIEPLEPNMGTVINDVLSFKYSIDIDRNKSRCNQWRNRSWVDLIAAYDDDINVNRTLLIAVVSAADNFSQRELIRKTWGTPENLKADWIQLIFLVGSLPFDKNKKRKKVQSLLFQESMNYQDIVQVDVTDSYEKLTLKSVSLLYWALTRCPGAQLVLKCDDDTYINFETLSELLGEEQFAYTNRIYGVGVFDNKPQRHPGMLIT